MSSAESGAKQFRLLGFFWGISPALLVIINVLSGAKIVQLGPLDLGILTIPSVVLAGGTVLFPITYVLDDLITEIYGYANAQRVIWTSFAALLFAMLAIILVGALPAPAFMSASEQSAQQSAFTNALGLVPRVNIASFVAVICGRYVNAAVVAAMKQMTGERLMGTRFVVSTILGEAVDTVLFLSIAFWGTKGTAALVVMCVSQYTFKILWEVVALPITILVVRKIKVIEQVD